MRYSFFIIWILIFAGHAAAKIFYTDSHRIGGHDDGITLAGDSKPGDSLTLYAAEVRCSMPGAAAGRHTSASWRLSWPSGQSVTLMFDHSGHIDGTDRPSAVMVTDNGCGAITRSSINSDLDFHGGPNTLCLEWRGGVASIFAGKNRLHGITSMAMPCPRGNCLVSATSRASLVDAAVEMISAPKLDSGLTADSIYAYFSAAGATRHPLEGIWEYLDRDTDPALAVEGGRYRIAIMPYATDSLQIIYLGGSVTNAKAWHPGMIKGTITDLGFTDHFWLDWLDAMQKPMERESYVTLLSDAVISFTFPLHSATLRFQRIGLSRRTTDSTTR